MVEEYEPKYLKGHLLVLFNDDCPRDMPEYLEKKFGYKIIQKEEVNWYIYDVGDKETKAIENFSKYQGFIEWVEKRDKRWENRSEFHYDLEHKIEKLNIDLPKKCFLKQLEDIKNFIGKFDDSTV
jgi:hypothetical protein